MEQFIPLKEKIESLVQEHYNKDFLYFENKKYTYQEMDNQVNKLVNGLVKNGVKKGSKVVLMLPSSDFFVFCLLANIKIGAITVPINLDHRGVSLEYIIKQSEAEYLIYTNKSHKQLINIQNNIQNIKQIITFNVDDINKKQWKIPVIESENFFENESNKIEFTLSLAHKNDIMEIIYTSGTTGPPKGVVWNQQKFNTNIAEDIGFTSSDIMYTPLPLFHALAQRMLFMCLINGATIALKSKFSASEFWEDINKYKATWFNYIGAIIPILLKQHPHPQDKYQNAKFAYGCGAPQDENVWNEFSERFKVKLFEYYGTTEAGAITLGNKPGSIGTQRNSQNVKIVGENNQECSTGEIGELLSKSHDPKHALKGYYKLKAESEEKMSGEWIKSGDLVYKDNEGFYYFVGRKVESMRRRGENISPWEIESVVNSHPKVLESAAIPIPSDVGEDEVKVYVVLKNNKYLSEESLLNHCEHEMATYLIPRYIEFLDELPKTSTEKIERVKLKREGINKNTWDSSLKQRVK